VHISQPGVGVERIGAISSLAPIAQMALDPLIFRRAMTSGGVAWMMAAAALACLTERPFGAWRRLTFCIKRVSG
jgi:hypothetical protein